MSEALVSEILRHLRDAARATSPVGCSRGTARLELDALSTISLLGEAVGNVNCMLLQQFVSDLGLRRRNQLAHAIRIMTNHGPLVVLTLEYEDGGDHCVLVYAEFGRTRPSAVFVREEVAFVRRAHIVVYPFAALDERVLARTSLHIRSPHRTRRGPGSYTHPPVA